MFGCASLDNATLSIGAEAMRLERWSQRPWQEAFIHHTSHYRVQTNTSQEAAVYIGKLMEEALENYRQLTGLRQEKFALLYINAYATRKDYEKVARELGFSKVVTNGLYSPWPVATIHLPFVWGRIREASITLLHEGMHQFLDQIMSLRVCDRKVLSVPLWLNEGLATYAEGNSRLLYLQSLIRAHKCPPLSKVLSIGYGKEFSADDYAVSWGLVYALEKDSEQQRKLWQYLQACRDSFLKDPDTGFTRGCLAKSDLPKDFNQRWPDYLARKSLELFKEIIVGQDSTLEAWEQDWAKRISQLNPDNSRSN